MKTPTARTPWLAWLLSGLSAAQAAPDTADTAEPPAHQQQVATSTRLGFESLRLPGGESMGLMGASLTFGLTDQLWLGPAVYGAASGQRGGFFVWGAEVQAHWPLGASWALTPGLFVGGGGGAGAPVGGGLMLRPHVDLMFTQQRWSAGLSASQVRFPNGEIRSHQLGLMLALRDDFSFVAPGLAGQSLPFVGTGGLGATRMAPTAAQYTRGAGQQRLGLVGLRLQRDINRVWSADLEGLGATHGGADGYAELMAGLAAQWPLPWDALRLGGRASLGLAGGGAVPTGGGVLAKLGASGSVQLNPMLLLQLESGRARSPGGGFQARYAQLSLGMQFGEAAIGTGEPQLQPMHEVTWALSAEAYPRAQRKATAPHAMTAIGLRFQRSLGEQNYLTGQTYSATTGGAGAYAIGLVGLGTTQALQAAPNWRLGLEALVGAAGGGGVATQGGAVVQSLAWLGRDLGRYSQVKLGAGWIKSVKGSLSSPVLDLHWALHFGTP